MMAQKFAAQVDAWCKESEDRLMMVFKRAVELLAEELARTRGNGGALPHRTGNLMRSLAARINALPPGGAPGAVYGGSDVGAVVAQALLGDSVSLGFQANYARRMNYGFVGQDRLGRNFNQSGAGFVERAAAMWPALVERAAAEFRDR
jgi:hypothetical protein